MIELIIKIMSIKDFSTEAIDIARGKNQIPLTLKQGLKWQLKKK